MKQCEGFSFPAPLKKGWIRKACGSIESLDTSWFFVLIDTTLWHFVYDGAL